MGLFMDLNRNNLQKAFTWGGPGEFDLRGRIIRKEFEKIFTVPELKKRPPLQQRFHQRQAR